MAFAVGMVINALQDAPVLMQTILAYLAYSIILGISYSVSKSVETSSSFNPFLVLVDCVAVTGLIYLTGGVHSPLYVFYLPILGVVLIQRTKTTFLKTAALSFALYSLIFFIQWPEHKIFWNKGLAQIILLGVLTGVLYTLLNLYLEKERVRKKLVSRANTLAQIADVLSGSLSNSRDWIRNITNIIDGEIHPDGLQCRIVINRGNQEYLPPSGEKLEVRFPIMVGECIFGNILVTREKTVPFTPSDQNFFSSIARSFGLSLHRAKLWEDFQKQLEDLRQSSEPHEPPQKRFGKAPYLKPNPTPLDDMIEKVRSERKR